MIYILIILLISFKAICKAISDTLLFHYSDSIFYHHHDSFWDTNISWRRKYKNGIPESGPKFFLSTTVLVFLTDGWHLVNWINNRFTDILLYIVLINFLNYSFTITIIILLFYNILKGVIFEKFFQKC